MKRNDYCYRSPTGNTIAIILHSLPSTPATSFKAQIIIPVERIPVLAVGPKEPNLSLRSNLNLNRIILILAIHLL